MEPGDSLPVRPSSLLQALRAVMVAGVLGLIVLGLAWELKLAPTGGGSLALKVLPLAFALPGLVRHRLYTVRWLSLLVWLYISEGLVRATSEGGLVVVMAIVEVALGALVFIACGWTVRRRLADGARLTGRPPGPASNRGSTGVEAP